MRNMLGTHLIPAHWGNFWGRHDADWIKAWAPRFVKVVCDDETVPHIAELPPAATIIVRNYPLSEQGHNRGFAAKSLSLTAAADMGLPQTGSGRDLARGGPGAFADAEALTGVVTRGMSDLPEAVGVAHAQAHARTAAWCKAQGVDPARLIFEGLNEPLLWATEPPELVARYEAARLKEAHRLGLRCVIGNFGVGWPGNGGVQDAPVQWDFFRPAIAQMVAGDYMGLHEYWALQGPTQNWKWWGGRFTQCPYRVPILITECGVDTGVTGQWYGGWGDIPAATWDERAAKYVDWLLWYAGQALADGRVQCVLPFSYDCN